MKIIIAHYKYHIQGGPERYMLKFMKLAEEHGCQVIPFSVDYPQNFQSEYSRYFVKPISKNTTGRFDASKLTLGSAAKGAMREFHNKEAARKLSQLIADENPDLIYTLIPGSLSSDIFFAAKKAGVPVILRLSDFRLICGKFTLLRGENICEECIHGDYDCMVKHRCVKGSKALSMLRCASMKYNRKHKRYRHVDAVITPPEFTRQKLIESGYFPTEKVFTNPTFIDCNQTELHYGHKNYVLCLGRFSPEKGFIYVVKAMQYLRDLPVSVAVTGNKEDCDKGLKQAIEDLNLEDKVQFVGFLHGEELERVTSEAMCVACPAIWYENLPNVVIESYSYGKPVIASNLGSLAEMVEDGKTGYLFEPKNPKEIADCIRKLYENPSLTLELGQNARKKCEEQYAPEKHWNTFMKIYNQIIEEKENERYYSCGRSRNKTVSTYDCNQ